MKNTQIKTTTILKTEETKKQDKYIKTHFLSFIKNDEEVKKRIRRTNSNIVNLIVTKIKEMPVQVSNDLSYEDFYNIVESVSKELNINVSEKVITNFSLKLAKKVFYDSEIGGFKYNKLFVVLRKNDKKEDLISFAIAEGLERDGLEVDEDEELNMYSCSLNFHTKKMLPEVLDTFLCSRRALEKNFM